MELLLRGTVHEERLTNPGPAKAWASIFPSDSNRLTPTSGVLALTM